MKILILSVFTAYSLNAMATKLEKRDLEKQIECTDGIMVKSCSDCPLKFEEDDTVTCGKDCIWNPNIENCACKALQEFDGVMKKVIGEMKIVSHKLKCVPEGFATCGGHVAEGCGECPKGAPNGQEKSWCNGDCEWSCKDMAQNCKNGLNEDGEAAYCKRKPVTEVREDKLGSEYELKFEKGETVE